MSKHYAAAKTAVTNFTTVDMPAGEARRVDGSLFPGETLAINGKTDLSQVIRGEHEACVFSITMDYTPTASLWESMITIVGRGPKGGKHLPKSLILEFTTDGGHRESKRFTSSTRHQATMEYSKEKPAIAKITWRVGSPLSAEG